MSNYHVQTLNRSVFWANFGNPVARLFATMVGWQQRHQLRRRLLELDDHLLDDIGVSRPMARREAAKPFWKD